MATTPILYRDDGSEVELPFKWIICSLPVRSNAADPSPVLAPTDSPLARTGEIVLTQGQKLALLAMRGSDLSKAVLARVIAQTRQGPAGRDFYSCARIGLATSKGSFHVLTPPGRWRADQLARDIAHAAGLHIITYDYGGPQRAANASCCCGWKVWRSRAIRSFVVQLGRDAHRHLTRVADKPGETA